MSNRKSPSGRAISWQDPVATSADLPAAGNTAGDARVTLDTTQVWLWDGTAWDAPSSSAAFDLFIPAPGFPVSPGGSVPIASFAAQVGGGLGIISGGKYILNGPGYYEVVWGMVVVGAGGSGMLIKDPAGVADVLGTYGSGSLAAIVFVGAGETAAQRTLDFTAASPFPGTLKQTQIKVQKLL